MQSGAAGVPGERIVFSGVGKTRDEMARAIEGGIRQFNVESEPELAVLSEVAAAMGAEVPIAVRVNPDVDARTHAKIATGKSENKFGIPIARARDRLSRINSPPSPSPCAVGWTATGPSSSRASTPRRGATVNVPTLPTGADTPRLPNGTMVSRPRLAQTVGRSAVLASLAADCAVASGAVSNRPARAAAREDSLRFLILFAG